MTRSRSAVRLLALAWLARVAAAQAPANTDALTILTGTKSLPATQPLTPTGPYTTYTSKITLSAATPSISASAPDGNGTSADVTYLTGSVTSSTSLAGNFSASSSTTAAAPRPTNTTPCNGWVEFCDRKYSNVSMVAAHNSPFVRPGNTASNQQLDVTAQLDDGVRLLQAQIQWPANATEPHFCHTSCDLLDAGPITDWLGRVRDWVAAHPYDIVTVLLGNGNYSHPSLYAPFIERSGLLQYAYSPPFLPMALGDWPTFAEMILTGKRVVFFLDYMADQLAYPWLLDEFSQVWESPFNPLDRNFPCTVQRPPGLPAAAARDRLYLFNGNLNAEFKVFGASILVPAVSLLNQTHNVTGFGSLGEAARRCTDDWGRPPNFLNVDYYNYGEGTVFQVAAKLNNVTYDKVCCGKVPSSAAQVQPVGALVLLAAVVVAGLLA